MFYCKLCVFEHLSFNSYVKHLTEHSSLTDKLICGFNRCSKVYTVLSSLQSHVHRCHSIKVTNNLSPAVNIQSIISEGCTVEFCMQKYTDHKQMISHLRMHINGIITVKCGYLDCKKTYNKLNSFSSHISRYHKEKLVKQSYDSCSNSNYTDFSDLAIENDKLIEKTLSLEEQCQYFKKNSSHIYLMNLAHFFLKLEFKFSLPASTVQYIAIQMCEMNKKNEEIIRCNLSKHLNQYNIPALQQTRSKMLSMLLLKIICLITLKIH